MHKPASIIPRVISAPDDGIVVVEETSTLGRWALAHFANSPSIWAENIGIRWGTVRCSTYPFTEEVGMAELAERVARLGKNA